MPIEDHLNDLEKIDSRHTTENVEYNLSSIDSAITALNEAKVLLDSTISKDLKNINSKKELWSGKSKEKFDELVNFYKSFQKDYKESVKQYHKSVSGLKNVANHIPKSKVLKEVDEL
ncbi:hypothetical protein [Carnobacterium maltaromaticum]|uniref:hypothetical protein n=1 Tax=Carnobacterium maltaromaticum TaxID=2751 RepID=UPI00295F2771|nr:hypothetical protein [Carnobacterium maltaromaticum]